VMRYVPALLFGIAVFAVVVLLRAPVGGCIQRSSGGMDPTSFWKECETVFGNSITIDNTHTQSKWVVNKPVEPSYGRAVLLASFAALVVGGLTLAFSREIR